MGAGLYSNVRNLRRYLAWLFAGVDLRGKRFLDVGAGQGLYSLYAAAQGACAVVALEPQAAGSRQGANARMQNLAQEWGLSLRHLPEDLEARTNAPLPEYRPVRYWLSQRTTCRTCRPDLLEDLLQVITEIVDRSDR